jgi:hypothetical protein
MTRIFAHLLAATALTAASPALAQHEGHGAPEPEPMDHGAMDHGSMDNAEPETEGHSGHDAPIQPMTHLPRHFDGCRSATFDTGQSTVYGTTCRPTEGSGTSRLPGWDAGFTHGNFEDGKWVVMPHGFLSAQYTDHGGPRGDDMAYATSMLMLTAESQPEWGRLQFKSMMSLEPLMDAKGYPNLFATGETANGAALVDRQHPHDLFMELAGRVDFNIGDAASLFLYGGPVGEPAIGPSAFMHRGSAANNPEPPIGHHWFDSTHITYGVITGGIATKTFQLEASAFRGAEPDEDRWGIETPKLDSWSVRATLNPAFEWAVQASYGEIEEPEALHPGEDEHRFTASAHYADGPLSAMLAFSAKNRVPGDTLTAFLAEVDWDFSEHDTLFGRFENVRNDEFFPDHDHPLHDMIFRVSKFQAGYARHIPLGETFALTIGGSASAYLKPVALDPFYGDNPLGFTLFARLSLGH